MKLTTPLVLSLALWQCGCALFSPPMEQPVQHDYVGSFFGDRKTSVFSLTPERRTVLVVRKVDGNTSSIMVCAEPPSDVAQNLSASVKALAEARVKADTGESASAAAEFSRSFSSAMTRIFARTQGVQLYRDGSFNLCQAYMNGLITPEVFVARQAALLDITATLIYAELPRLQASMQEEQMNELRAAKASLDDAVRQLKGTTAAARPGEPVAPALPDAPAAPTLPTAPAVPAEPAGPSVPRGGATP